MADTRQIVLWSLDYGCSLRGPVDPAKPRDVLARISRAKHFSHARGKNGHGSGVFGDVFVTGYTASEPPDGGKLSAEEVFASLHFNQGKTTSVAKPAPRPYPCSGYLISREFGESGGPEAVQAMCGNCPANTDPAYSAGCAGTLWQSPDSPETEAQIQGILARLNLEAEYARLFPKTSPHWYGLWMRSPVPPPALPLLRTIIAEILSEDREAPNVKTNPGLASQSKGFETFLRAAEIAEQHQINLRVYLPPLGHTDFGFHTVFPHCPLCKAAAEIKRWQRKYPQEPHLCPVCGHAYSPAATASSERMDHEDDFDLQSLLGPAEFQKFARDYLVAHGASEDEATKRVAATEEKQRQRQQKMLDQQKRSKAERKYIREKLCSGLELHRGAAQDLEDNWPPKFKAAAFAEVLKRCREAGVSVFYLHHESADGDSDQYVTRPADPEELLRSWIAEGCDGLFYGNFRVPDALLES